ncbi:zinc finger and BTB domain-containing protein 4 isoform X2 [Hippocampus zosterae]|nr:zinc finger and BTB domain-containing protein 4 isoform X2 [Hippocampus zosterae]XP_051933917.1 zinc finger and BTB domain-containing protein 4 isoform X2 [Hippocampus zosterae]XP_051933927.1 zinc finger and BTB domain-containing protein 4 isoform X2 [Hippocampus zosterae]XP_051933938.1 zinc finger and BTB domain-containing protein 4 isoform X2 [Hippocampus zosterae]
MVSGVKAWDPLHAGPIRSRPSERRPAFEDDPRRQSRRPTPPSSPPPSPSTRGSAEASPPPPAGWNRAEAAARPGMKGAKRRGGRGDATMEDGPGNAQITLSFPASAGPLAASPTSPGYCRNGASSSSPHRRRASSKSSDEGSLWKLDSTTDIKHRPFKPPRHDGSPSSSPSSSSSMTAKDIKSPPPLLKCSKAPPETHFARSAPSSLDGWDERRGPLNGAASPSPTAQILFSLGAYRAEPKEKSGGPSPHGAGLPPPPPPPALHLPPPPEGLGAEPELICGVCRRLFSSAASLAVHMRLHGGSRAPPGCRFCGKVFIHGKRLHSHEASCRAALAVRPKEEPAEAGEAPTDAGSPGPEKNVGGHFAKVVDGNVIYFCSVCERSYMTLSSLKRHSNVHSWRRRYPCRFCDKVFALAEYRTKHEVWHTGERRYQCIFCWDAFATYYNLKTHQKAIHGINPGLISSEKTANGGYKQKADALKLYRLLPMRSHKRPYKTYSHSLVSPAEDPPRPPPPPADLQTFMGGACHPQSVKPDPDRFTGDVPAADGECAPSPPFPRKTDLARDRERHGEARGFRPLPTSCPETKSHRAAEPSGAPSVIAYGHPKPSVIVHGTAASSSVIVRGEQPAPAGEPKQPHDVAVARRSHKGGSGSRKRPRDGADGHGKRSRDNSEAATPDARSDGGPCFKSRKSHGKNEPSSPEPPPPPPSSSSPSGPLCQITVRIGEEAIVKRSISETDLRRDKSRSPPKDKKAAKAARVRRRASRGGAGNSSDELRDYDSGRKPREPESDHDAEDNLWRPYYSYKPKKKAQAHLQRLKSWQRKLKLKRALRLKRRAERLKKRAGGPRHHDEGEGAKPPGADERGCAIDAKPAKDNRAELAAAASPPPPRPPLAGAAAPSKPKRRPWTAGNVAECATCGCWFSSSGKRDQHELSHLLEFVCLFCRAAFPSRDKLEDHQRIQHPKPADASWALQKTQLAQQAPEKELPVDWSRPGPAPAHLSRRALSRHTCPQCHKVCKTSSALGRHVRRHQFKEEDVAPPQAAAAAVGNAEALPPKGQVVSVISYSTADPPKSAGPSSSPDRRADPRPEGEGGPKANEGPVNLTPARARLAPATPPPALHSVLVMNRPECLDYRTAGKRGPASPARSPAAPNASSEAPPSGIAAAAPPVSMATVHGSGRGFATRDGVIMDGERRARGTTFARAGFEGPPSVQDLQVRSPSRSTSPGEAQDLTMSSILAREREMERQTLRGRRERPKDKEAEGLRRTEATPAEQTPLLVPKEEPLSPAPSPQHIPCQSGTGPNGPPPSRRHAAHSPCRSAAAKRAREAERLASPGGGDRPSAHALLLPRPAKPPERQEPACYARRDYGLPPMAPDNYRPAKKQRDELLATSYPTGALPFGPLAKMMVPNGADLAKLPFYPDPYQLLYGSQLLAYPYNMAALPVALNMVAPGADKAEPLPFLPAIFNYGAGPYAGAAPHPLVADPAFYAGGKKQRDGGAHKP